MINELTHMAAALTPPMYRYLKMYIRFLLPEKDRPVEEILQFLRTTRSRDADVITNHLALKYKTRRLRYLFNKLWILLEEVRMDPLQPWNEKIFESNDLTAQRKLYGGICLAMSGLAEPAYYRFIEADEAAGQLSGSNPALRLQTSWFRSHAHDPIPQVQERIGALVSDYMSAVKAKSLLFQTIYACLVEGNPPENECLPDHHNIRAMEMTNLIHYTLHAVEKQQYSLMNECLEQCEKISAFYHNDEPLIYPLLLLRSGLNIKGGSPDSMKLARGLLEKGIRLLPNGHKMYPLAIRCLFINTLLIDGVRDAEKIWDEHQGRMLYNTMTSFTYLFEALIACVQNDSRTALKALAKVNTKVYNNPDIRFFELMILIQQNDHYTVACKLESIRKLLVRRGETQGRRRNVYKILRCLELRNFEFEETRKRRDAEFQELQALWPWQPHEGELIPIHLWFQSQIENKPISLILQQFRKSATAR